ncbi:MAG: S41 family peptidase [Dehalococcoidales bacterium]|nr:S41 family peptidase [Dehalococcoidales bacterium]
MSKEIKIILICLSIALAMGVCFQTGYYMGLEQENVPQTEDPYLASIEEAWNKINAYYVENDSIDYELLSQYAIEGMLEYLDDNHSAYLDPEAYAKDAEETSGSYSGIGVVASLIEGNFVIVSIYDNSPAAQSGLLAGDIILAVDGITTEGMSFAELIIRVRGEEGTPVTLQILHSDASQPVDIIVMRAEIDVPSVYSEMIGTIAYIIIDRFSQDTDEEFSKLLKDVIDAGATGIVLDLRNNLGGLLNTLINVASCFYSEGNILTVRENDGSTREYDANKQSVTTDLPLVVLVNGYSASASEALSGALQDHDRAIIAGTTTYGKGSVNVMYALPNGGGLYLTTARWFTPNGNLIESAGITPDFVTDLTGDELVQWAVDYLNGNID